MLSNRLRAIVGAMALLFWAIPAVADVCYLPNSNCGLLGPEEKGPVPVPDDDKNKCPADYVKDCPRINTTLQKYDKKDGCCRAVCLYESQPDCVAKSSTNYCELDSQTQCYKQAVAPVTCVGYNDTAEKAEDPNCDCEQCEDTTTNTTRYKCECVEPTPETCKSYGESLTPPQIYDTESSLVCGSNQKKQSINKIKNDKMCYQCVNKTCEDYGKKDKGQCGNGFREVDDTAHPGCVECVPQQVENNEICFKLVFKCNGETCSDSDLEKIGINNTLTFNNPDSLTPSYSSDQHTGYSGSSTCYRKQDILAMMNNRDKDYYAMPYVALKVETNVDDYNSNHPNENNYFFKNSDNDNFFTKYVALINNNGTLQYTLINKHGKDQSDDTNSGVGIVPGEYIECYAKMCEDGNTNNCTYDKIYKCYWENKDIKQVTSSTIEIPVELGNFTGAQKCIYFTAKCPDLQKNGGKAENCIDKVTATIIASKSTQDSSRVGTIFEYYPNKIREPQSGYYKVSYKDMSFNEGSTINGNNVTFKICGYDEYTTEEGDPVAANYIQDWDNVSVYVEANRKVDSNGNGGYLYADKNYDDNLYDDSIIKGSNEEYCTKGSSPTWGNLCKDNTYLYELSDIQKSAKFVPILIYNFSIKETSKGSGKDYKLYWTYGITTNKQLKDDIIVYQYNAFEQAACTVGAQIYKDSSNHFTTIYKNQSCNYHKTDGNYCTTDKYDIIRINYNPNLDCELHYSYEFRAEIAGRYNLEPGYSFRDGYYYIVTGLSKKTK